MLKRIVILVMLLPTMVFSQPLDSVVAIVNDGVITQSELDNQVQALRQQLTARKMEVPGEKALRKQVLQHLIDVDLQLQLAKQNDINIDSTELNDAISKIASTNHLNLTQLREELGRQGISWKAYRDDIRKEMLLSRLQQKAVAKEITVTPQQVEDYLKTAQYEDKTQYTYHLLNIVIPLPEEPTTTQVNKAKQKANDLLAKINKGENFGSIAIAESSGEFALEGGDLGVRHLAELPEVFAKQVIHMKKGQVAGPLRTGNGFQLIKLVDIGGENQKHEVTKTHVRHILLKQDASTTSGEAEKQAYNVYQQLKAGKDFAHMAKQYSLDATSAIKGGDLGWVNSGDLVPEFEKAMDGLPVNKISKPVKSPYGWHIIQVLGRKTIDDSASFKRQQVRQFLQQRKFTEAVQNWQQHLRADAYIKIMDRELA